MFTNKKGKKDKFSAMENETECATFSEMMSISKNSIQWSKCWVKWVESGILCTITIPFRWTFITVVVVVCEVWL